MTSRFLSDLDTRLVDEFDDIHELLAPFSFYSELLGCVIEVPKGFRTDFASVPRMIGAYLMFGGKGKRAAVIHDWLYSGGLAVTREQADAVFKEALRVSGYSAFTIWMMHAGVRVGGESHYQAPNLPQPEEVAESLWRPTPVFEAP
jgi:hypothetical protein